MSKTQQPIYLATTPEGEKYFEQLVAVGYVNLQTTQRVEWNILHDLILQGDPVKMGTFLAEGRDTILGRAFSSLSERPHGQLALEGYGKTLHRLIKEGYIKAFKQEPQL